MTLQNDPNRQSLKKKKCMIVSDSAEARQTAKPRYSET